MLRSLLFYFSTCEESVLPVLFFITIVLLYLNMSIFGQLLLQEVLGILSIVDVHTRRLSCFTGAARNCYYEVYTKLSVWFTAKLV